MITLESITEGMKVYDSRNDEIGTVEYVKMVDTDPATGQPVTADIPVRDDRSDSILDNLAEAFTVDEVPEEIQQRLLRDGFVRMDADGIFAADRYILPDQISSVAGDRIVLNVSKSELQKAN